MKRSLAREKFFRKAAALAVLLCFSALGIFLAYANAIKINDGDQVDENTELTYYITVTADGIDSAKISSETGQVANINTGTLSVKDQLPQYLSFIGFETPEDGSFGAVSQNDHSIACDGTVIDDTHGEGTEGTDTYYHGLHYNTSNRTLTYQVAHLQAGCELTIGVKVLTPSLPAANTRYDFYNTAQKTGQHWW